MSTAVKSCLSNCMVHSFPCQLHGVNERVVTVGCHVINIEDRLQLRT